jgi:ubiquinone/menaquinone biosynthesis C-methylase UbiE
MNDDKTRTIQNQFGAHASEYVDSAVHAKGYSLQRLIELTAPRPEWIVLDIATGGGHTARRFAPHVRQVIASDVTHRMLLAARGNFEKHDLHQITVQQANAEALPYPDEAFDLVTCRVAAHHFGNVNVFLEEARRVLKPAGLLALADNISSEEARTAQYLNIFDKLRDPSHGWAYSLQDWLSFFPSSGLQVNHHEVHHKWIDFDEWADRMGVAGDDLHRLRALLLQAPKPVADWLQPRRVGHRLTFMLAEAIVIGQKFSRAISLSPGAGGGKD